MKQSVLRFAAQLWAMLAVLLLFVAAALPAHADDGDMDEITHYTVTVDTRADGSADITYELDWNVIGGSLDEPLTWVRIGLRQHGRDRCIRVCDLVSVQWPAGGAGKEIFALVFLSVLPGAFVGAGGNSGDGVMVRGRLLPLHTPRDDASIIPYK